VLLYFFIIAHFKILSVDKINLSVHRIFHHLSAHPIPKSIYRHMLFPSRSIGPPYSPIDLSTHAIPQSTYQPTLFSKRSIDSPNSQSTYRCTLFPNRSVGTSLSPVDLSTHSVSQSSWTNDQVATLPSNSVPVQHSLIIFPQSLFDVRR
jgi:hypothetical protein